MRKTGSFLGVVALLWVLASGSARAGGFLSAYDDLPLPAALAEMGGAGLSFDSPGGRIVEAYARGRMQPAEVYAFYASTLPQLGWTRDSDTVYRREAEVLKLAIQSEGREVVVHFIIAPE